MQKVIIQIFIFFLIMFPLRSNTQSIVINEFMADNEDTILDEDGDASDWIELYNKGETAVNLNGYYLSDKQEDLKKWKFPPVVIPSGEFLLIFASGKDIDQAQNLHTNFKISSDGELITLSDPNGVIIDQFEEIELDEDESFGRLPDGSEIRTILPNQTPGFSNNSLNKLVFSQPSGFYEEDLELTINSLLGDTIYYTTDGSEPTVESIEYQSPILLKDRTSAPNIWCEIPSTPEANLITNPGWESPGYSVTKANIIRCASFKNGIKTSETYTRTYFVQNGIFDRYTMPVISLVTEGSNFFDHDNGIYVPGAAYDPLDPEWSGNYFIDEFVSERPTHIEFFDQVGNLQFGQNAGARIHGGKTRHASQKSLKLYARADYGSKFFNHQLMPQKEVDKYKRFVLQTTMSSWNGDTVIKDILAHEIVRTLNLERMDYQPAVVFLNGEYWGIHHIRDRIDEEYLSYTSGLSLDSLEIDRVGNSHFRDLINYFKDHIPIDNEELEYISTQMDIEGFIDYQIAEMFLNNYDWPSNNSKHWRPKFNDGKWRWIFFDIDAGFADPHKNMFEHNTNADSTISWPNSPKATFFFRSLIENETFLEQFLERYKELLESEFKPSRTKEKLFALIKQYTPELPHHIKRWHFPPTMEDWLSDIERDLIVFLEDRPCAVKEHIQDFFNMPSFEVDCLDTVENFEPIDTSLQLKVSPNPSHGTFSVKNNSSFDRLFSIKLYNAIGQIRYDSDRIILVANDSYTIDVSGIASGIYFLNIQEDSSTTTQSIFITNQ